MKIEHDVTHTTNNIFAAINHATAAKIADQFGTPIFIMQEQGIIERYHTFHNNVTKRYPHAKVAISYKTNFIPALLSLLHKEGALPEVVSGIEYNMALKIRKNNQPIIFNGPMKTTQELLQAIHDGSLINCDHEDEINRIEQIAKNLQKQVSIGLRIYFKDSDYHWNRFGFPVSLDESQQTITQLIQRILNSPYLKLAGLHTHIGTNIRDINTFGKLAHKLNEFAVILKQYFNIELQWLDMGGGLAGISPRIDEYQLLPHTLPDINHYAQSVITPLLPYLNSLSKPATLYFEPGRTLFEAYGSLLTQVIGKRDKDDSGLPAYIFDAGINSLSTSYVYNFPIQTFTKEIHKEKAYLYGPTCMQNDQLHTPTELPQLNINDLLLFHGVGSYCMAFSYSFIRLRPGVVLLRKNNEIAWLRKPESLTHMAALDVMPESEEFNHVIN